MRKKILLILAGLFVIGGLAACDPTPPYSGCEFIAAGEDYRGNGVTYSKPYSFDYFQTMQDSGWTVNYNSTTKMWYTPAGPDQIVHGYSLDQWDHVWSCPV